MDDCRKSVKGCIELNQDMNENEYEQKETSKKKTIAERRGLESREKREREEDG